MPHPLLSHRLGYSNAIIVPVSCTALTQKGQRMIWKATSLATTRKTSGSKLTSNQKKVEVTSALGSRLYTPRIFNHSSLRPAPSCSRQHLSKFLSCIPKHTYIHCVAVYVCVMVAMWELYICVVVAMWERCMSVYIYMYIH